MTMIDGSPLVPDYTATLVTHECAEVLEDLLDDLPGSAVIGPDDDGRCSLVFGVTAEAPHLALLAACGTAARVLGDTITGQWLALSVQPA